MPGQRLREVPGNLTSVELGKVNIFGTEKVAKTDHFKHHFLHLVPQSNNFKIILELW